MKVSVLFFGPAATVSGCDRRDVELADGATLTVLVDEILRLHPDMAGLCKSLRFAVNQEYATHQTVLSPGDEVAVIPPVAGGGTQELVEMTDKPIDLRRLIDQVAHDSCGAVVTFQGNVRAEGTEDPLIALEYSAYGEMAVNEMRRIRTQAVERFAVRDVAIVHRVGHLSLGQTSIAIAVAAPQRSDALDACRFVIDTLKRTVPIWKKEIFNSGKTRWVDPAQSR